MEATKERPQTRRDMRHDALVKELVHDAETGKPRPMKEVLEKVGYSREVARTQAKRVMTSESLQLHLAEHGLGEYQVRKVLSEAMEANTVVVFKGQAHESDVPDHRMRVGALSLLADVTGLKKVVVENHNINVDMSADAVRDMLGM